MAKSEQKLDWLRLDMAACPDSLKAHMERVQEALKAANAAKQAFQSAFLKLSGPKGMTADNTAFAYKFGTISIARVDPTTKAASGKTFSF